MNAYDHEAVRAMVREAEARYPSECCGLVFVSGDGRLDVRPLKNVIDRYHARRPDRFPRTSAQGYLIDPLAQLTALEEAEARGERLCAIFHSHIEVGAYFSAEDQALAIGEGGQVLFPGADYVVLSVRAGRCDAIKVFEIGTDQVARGQDLSWVA